MTTVQQLSSTAPIHHVIQPPLISTSQPCAAAEPYPFVNIRLGDSYDLLPELPDQSIDAIISDPPYATTDCAWDLKLDWPRMWAELTRVIKPGGAIVMTAAQPFTTDLINSNRARFRYELIYHKSRVTGWLDANKRPMRNHENIIVFCDRRTTRIYNPQKIAGEPYNRKVTAGEGGVKKRAARHGEHVYKAKQVVKSDNPTGERHPASVLQFPMSNKERGLHPTQKPVELFEYLIRTYSNPGETVLDNCIGSGTTAVAAIRSDRNYIGIEQDENYFTIAQQQTAKARLQALAS